MNFTLAQLQTWLPMAVPVVGTLKADQLTSVCIQAVPSATAMNVPMGSARRPKSSVPDSAISLPTCPMTFYGSLHE